MDFRGQQPPPPDDLEEVAQLIMDATAPGRSPLPRAQDVDESVAPFASPVDSHLAGHEPAVRPAVHVEPAPPRDSDDGKQSHAVEADATTGAVEPVTVAAAATSVELLQRLDVFGASVEALQRLFETKILRSDAEGEINAKLHAELQTYKHDLYAKLLKPILSDIITVREHVIKVSAHRRSEGETFIDLDTFESFADDLAQVLQENEVEIERDEPGALFNSQRHQVVGRVETEDPTADRTLATAVGDTYLYQGRPISRQRVTVYGYGPSSTGEPQ